jgi:tryptophan-rich sensory protein
MHVCKGTNNKLVHIFQLQKSIIIYLVYICCNFVYKCIFFHVDNLNLATNLENDCSCAMLIA